MCSSRRYSKVIGEEKRCTKAKFRFTISVEVFIGENVAKSTYSNSMGWFGGRKLERPSVSMLFAMMFSIANHIGMD